MPTTTSTATVFSVISANANVPIKHTFITRMPEDNLSLMLSHLTLKEIVNFGKINKEHNKAVKAAHPVYSALVKGQEIYNQCESKLDLTLRKPLKSHNGLLALGEKLITPAQIQEFKIDQLQLGAIFSPVGFKIWRAMLTEKLLTFEQWNQLSTVKRSALLLDCEDRFLCALREKLIIFQNLCDFEDVGELLSVNGLEALRTRLIDLRSAKQMEEGGMLALLYSEQCFAALKARKINIGEVIQKGGAYLCAILVKFQKQQEVEAARLVNGPLSRRPVA